MTTHTRAIVVEPPHQLGLAEVPVPEVGPGQVLVRIHTGGICGSDLHYYQHGGFGAVRVRQPLVLGHEISGTIAACGPDVSDVAVGARVAVNPSLPCGTCEPCRAGRHHHCTNMRFLGSAMRMPHVQGGFRDLLVCEARQVVPVPDSLSLAEAAMAEPLAVCLHAANRAGEIAGRRVLITGAGPIGLLLVAVCRLQGAARIVVTDRIAHPLRLAGEMGADSVVNVGEDPQALHEWVAANHRFDVHFEASGSAAAMADGMAALGALGVLVVVGQGAEVRLAASDLIAREIDIRGSFRFDGEYRTAVDLLAARRLDIRRMVSATLPAAEYQRAFDLALDKSQSAKVQLSFA